QVDGELINLLYRHSRGLHVSTIVGAALMGMLFLGAVNAAVLVPWCVYMVITGFSRALVAARFNRSEIALEDAAQWEQRFRLGNLLAGLGWGTAGILLFLPGNGTLQLLLTVIIVAVIAASLPSLSASRRMFAQFALLAIAPLLMRHLLEGT